MKFRDPPRAVESARRACELSNWDNTEWIEVLATAHAQAGRFDQALKWENVALKSGDFTSEGLAAARRRCESYQQQLEQNAHTTAQPGARDVQ